MYVHNWTIPLECVLSLRAIPLKHVGGGRTGSLIKICRGGGGWGSKEFKFVGGRGIYVQRSDARYRPCFGLPQTMFRSVPDLLVYHL